MQTNGWLMRCAVMMLNRSAEGECVGSISLVIFLEADMDDFMLLGGRFFMRKQRVNGVDVTMMIGIIPQDLITTKQDFDGEEGPADELWLMEFAPVLVKKYKVPSKPYGGYRADQILCGGPRIEECEEI